MCWILPGGTTRLYSNLPEGITRLPPGSAGCLQASPDSPDAPGTGHSMTLLHPLSSAELSALAEEFSNTIPEQSFSMAELQGYCISHKDDAHLAVKSARAWVEQVIADRERIELYRSEKRRAAQARRDRSSSVGPSSIPFRDCGRGKSIGESDSRLREETSGGGTLFSESNASALCSPSSGPSEIVLSTNDSPAVDIDEEKLDDQSPTEAEPVSMDDVSA